MKRVIYQEDSILGLSLAETFPNGSMLIHAEYFPKEDRIYFSDESYKEVKSFKEAFNFLSKLANYETKGL